MLNCNDNNIKVMNGNDNKIKVMNGNDNKIKVMNGNKNKIKVMNGGKNLPDFPLKTVDINGEKRYCFDINNIDIIDTEAYPVGFVISIDMVRDYKLCRNRKTGKKQWQLLDIHPGYDKYVTLNNAVTPYGVYNNSIKKHVIVYMYEDSGKNDDSYFFIENISENILFNKYKNMPENHKKRVKWYISDNYCLPFNKFVCEFYYEKIFIGDDPSYYSPNHCKGVMGNSILLKIKNLEYILILGGYIKKFEAPEEIIKFRSSVNNATESCPLAETQNYWIYNDEYYEKKNYKNEQNKNFEDFKIYTCHFFPVNKGKKIKVEIVHTIDSY